MITFGTGRGNRGKTPKPVETSVRRQGHSKKKGVEHFYAGKRMASTKGLCKKEKRGDGTERKGDPHQKIEKCWMMWEVD